MLKIKKVQNSVVTELLNVYNEALVSVIADKQDVSRIMNVRCSSLPFCSLTFFINHATNGVYRYLDMKGTFYTAIGTTVHEVAQKHIGLSGKFLADWKCVICNTEYKLSMTNECCDFPCTFEEISVKWKTKDGFISGHIDGIFKAADGKYYILDYKTTGVKAALTKQNDPGIVYREQVFMYAMLMWTTYKIKIAGVILFFIPRDDLKVPVVYYRPFTKVDFTKAKNKATKYIREHKQALEVETISQALLLMDNGNCKNPYCKICTKTNIKSLVTEAYRIGVQRKNLPIKNLGNKNEY